MIKRPDDAPSKCRTDMKAESRQLSPLRWQKRSVTNIYFQNLLLSLNSQFIKGWSVYKIPIMYKPLQGMAPTYPNLNECLKCFLKSLLKLPLILSISLKLSLQLSLQLTLKLSFKLTLKLTLKLSFKLSFKLSLELSLKLSLRLSFELSSLKLIISHTDR